MCARSRKSHTRTRVRLHHQQQQQHTHRAHIFHRGSTGTIHILHTHTHSHYSTYITYSSIYTYIRDPYTCNTHLRRWNLHTIKQQTRRTTTTTTTANQFHRTNDQNPLAQTNIHLIRHTVFICTLATRWWLPNRAPMFPSVDGREFWAEIVKILSSTTVRIADETTVFFLWVYSAPWKLKRSNSAQFSIQTDSNPRNVREHGGRNNAPTRRRSI